MLLAPSLNLDPYEPSKEYPLFVKPDSKISKDAILEVLKDYYEGTVLDEYGSQETQFETIVNATSGHYRYSPAWCKSRIIGCPQTITSWITQSRSGMPDAIGGLIWAGLAAAASSPHLPFYAHNTRTPHAYQIGDAGDNSVYLPDSAYWIFENIGNLMNLFYQGTVELVKPVWREFDFHQFNNQSAIEQTATLLYQQSPAKAVEFLTSYSNGIAQEALDLGRDMLGRLFTRIALLNNPQTSRGYEDPKNWKASGTIY